MQYQTKPSTSERSASRFIAASVTDSYWNPSLAHPKPPRPRTPSPQLGYCLRLPNDRWHDTEADKGHWGIERTRWERRDGRQWEAKGSAEDRRLSSVALAKPGLASIDNMPVPTERTNLFSSRIPAVSISLVPPEDDCSPISPFTLPPSRKPQRTASSYLGPPANIPTLHTPASEVPPFRLIGSGPQPERKVTFDDISSLEQRHGDLGLLGPGPPFNQEADNPYFPSLATIELIEREEALNSQPVTPLRRRKSTSSRPPVFASKRPKQTSQRSLPADLKQVDEFLSSQGQRSYLSGSTAEGGHQIEVVFGRPPLTGPPRYAKSETADDEMLEPALGLLQRHTLAISAPGHVTDEALRSLSSAHVQGSSSSYGHAPTRHRANDSTRGSGMLAWLRCDLPRPSRKQATLSSSVSNARTFRTDCPSLEPLPRLVPPSATMTLFNASAPVKSSKSLRSQQVAQHTKALAHLPCEARRIATPPLHDGRNGRVHGFFSDFLVSNNGTSGTTSLLRPGKHKQPFPMPRDTINTLSELDEMENPDDPKDTRDWYRVRLDHIFKDDVDESDDEDELQK